MNAELKKLYDQKGKAWAQMEAVGERLKKGEKLTKEEDDQFKAWDKELEEANESIRKIERLEEVRKTGAVTKLRAEEVEPDQVKTFNLKPHEARTIFLKAEHGQKLSKLEQEKFDFMVAQDTVFRSFMNGEDLNEQERSILGTLRTSTKDFDGNMRAQTVTTTGGGYLIPAGFLNDIIVYLKFVSPFFEEMKIGPSAVAKNLFYFLNTPTGNSLPCPALDDTANTGELVAINTDIFTNTTDMAFTQITMLAYKYGPKPMKVPSELLQDSGVDIPGLVTETLATRLGRILNTHLTTGDNSSKPQGIVAGASVGVVSAGNDAITFSDIIDLVHSVDPAYRKSPSARFMLHDGVLKYIKKLSIGSSDARPLWMPSFRDGAPDTIDGYQYLINQDMQATVADGTKVMLFGDMKAYAVRQAGPMVLKFLGERFADIDQVAWMLLGRFDGRIRNSSAIKYLEVS